MEKTLSVLLGGVALLVAGPALGCPKCFGSTPYATGLFWSVALLLPIPFLILALLFLKVRRLGAGKGLD